jgi:hypothetical protein
LEGFGFFAVGDWVFGIHKNLHQFKDLPDIPATVFINSWMLDQYFTAKSKHINTFFGQFALLFGHGEKTGFFKHNTRLATAASRAFAGACHAPL